MNPDPAVLRPGGHTRPELRLIHHNGTQAVVKDYRACPPRFRLLVGRWLVAREANTYRLLEGLPGIPRLLARDSTSLVIEYVEGMNCADCRPDQVGPEFFDRLNRLVEQIHQRGVAHCDLKHQGNVVVGPGGQPYVVDLAAAIFRFGWPGFLHRWLYEFFTVDDRKAIVKLKRRLRPEMVTPDEQALLSHRGALERTYRWFRPYLRGTLRWITGIPKRHRR